MLLQIIMREAIAAAHLPQNEQVMRGVVEELVIAAVSRLRWSS